MNADFEQRQSLEIAATESMSSSGIRNRNVFMAFIKAPPLDIYCFDLFISAETSAFLPQSGKEGRTVPAFN
jgi:hypothetical protein